MLGRVGGDELPNTVDSLIAIRVVASRRRLKARNSDKVPEQELPSANIRISGGVIMSEF